MSSPCMWGSRFGGSAAVAKVRVPPGFPWAAARPARSPTASPMAAAPLPFRNVRRLRPRVRIAPPPSLFAELGDQVLDPGAGLVDQLLAGRPVVGRLPLLDLVDKARLDGPEELPQLRL